MTSEEKLRAVTFEQWFDLWDQTHDPEVRRLCGIAWRTALTFAPPSPEPPTCRSGWLECTKEKPCRNHARAWAESKFDPGTAAIPPADAKAALLRRDAEQRLEEHKLTCPKCHNALGEPRDCYRAAALKEQVSK
jgi:hypothetical protein